MAYMIRCQNLLKNCSSQQQEFFKKARHFKNKNTILKWFVELVKAQMVYKDTKRCMNGAS